MTVTVIVIVTEGSSSTDSGHAHGCNEDNSNTSSQQSVWRMHDSSVIKHHSDASMVGCCIAMMQAAMHGFLITLHSLHLYARRVQPGIYTLQKQTGRLGRADSSFSCIFVAAKLSCECCAEHAYSVTAPLALLNIRLLFSTKTELPSGCWVQVGSCLLHMKAQQLLGLSAGMSKARGSILSLQACRCVESALTCWGQLPGIWKETGRTRVAVTSTAASVLARPLVAPARSCTAASLAAARASAPGMLLKLLCCVSLPPPQKATEG